jgi:putative DNA methylase
LSQSAKYRKKLIEVALPLEAINTASAREKSIRHGHPSTLHLWWARRPLAAARAVIFAQMVDDPSSCPELFPTEAEQEAERQRLFGIIEELVLWENTTNEEVLKKARAEIEKSWRRSCEANAHHPDAAELFDPEKIPAFHDPFAGGGALPLEAQRLGLESYASDLNPVAVLINKAMIEIPPRFAGLPSVNPEAQGRKELLFDKVWHGAEGLAEDVRYYGQWMRERAEERIGHLYRPVKITSGLVKKRPDLKQYEGRELDVVAWLWARTVKSPNPAFANVEVPLISNFMLCTKKGKEAYVEPIVEGDKYHFEVRIGKPKSLSAAKAGTKIGRGAHFQCIVSETPIPSDYLYSEARSGRLGAKLMAIVVQGDRGRVFVPPVDSHEAIALTAVPHWKPDLEMPDNPRWFSPPLYGLATYGDLFTSRQLVVLNTFCDLVAEARERVKQDGLLKGLVDDMRGLDDGGTGASAYGEAVAVFLAFALDKVVDRGSSLGRWDPTPTQSGIINTFSRQSLPMTWDYAESNPLGNASGNFVGAVKLVAKVIERMPAKGVGHSSQRNGADQSLSYSKLISTDPPYYDNIGYADLSDFFYVWLRRSLSSIFPDLFATMAVPKAEELVATPYRHGGKEQAERFFLEGMTRAMSQLALQSHPGFPATIYYAFKQAERKNDGGTASTGWETFLDAVISAGFSLGGTWPMRTELANRMIGSGTNALASSIVLVCRKRPDSAPTVTRRDFLKALRFELPEALIHLQRGNIAPVDLAQSAIGPGMAIFTRYGKVLNADGSQMSVRDALVAVNQVLDETLTEQEGDFDADTRWALAWFEQFGFTEGGYGVAETLSKAKNTSVRGAEEAGILISKAGKVRLLSPDDLESDWDPETEKRLTVWETVHHLIRVLNTDGESGAAALVSKLGSKAEVARELCYRLYQMCERKKRAADALAYNALVQSFPEITRLAQEMRTAAPAGVGADQGELF